jgi:hypothetical protein
VLSSSRSLSTTFFSLVSAGAGTSDLPGAPAAPERMSSLACLPSICRIC